MHVGDFIAKAASRFPNHIAVVTEERSFTTKEFFERVKRLANAMLSLGLKKGDRVAVLLNNSHQCVECLYGIPYAGLVFVRMNTRNSSKEHLYVLDDSEAKAIILGQEFTGVIGSILTAHPRILHAICVNERTVKSMLSYEELLAKASIQEPGVEIFDEDINSIRYTAGTTGQAKGVMQTHKNHVICFYNNLMDGIRIDEGDVFAPMGPVTHVSGSPILPHIIRGARVVILSRFDIKYLFEMIQRERITTLFLVPTMIVMILAHPDLKKYLKEYDLSSLKTIYYAASPISPDVLKRGIDVFGDVFVQVYGLTEAITPITVLLKEDHILDGTKESLKRLSSIGHEVTVVRVRIMNEEGMILPPNQIGEIVVKSDQVMKGYWKNPEATAEALRNGWLHTRDLGYMDEDGYIYLLDRKDDMIVSGGFNIYPKEIEDVLYMHPAVLEAGVFGVPDDVWGESVKAVISLRAGMTVTEAEIIDHCKKHLASYKKPKSVDLIKDLPKNPYGKILRRKLKEPYWKDHERMIH